MNRKPTQILAATASLALLALVAIFAVGNITWSSTGATAGLSALNVDPIVLPEAILQEIENNGFGTGSRFG